MTIPEAPVAFLAGTFPSQTETFVYRELRALREAGFRIQAVSLRHPGELVQERFGDLLHGLTVVYLFGTLFAFVIELVLHPLAFLATVGLALRDALLPGEKTDLATRLKLVPQAFGGVALAHKLRKAGVCHIHSHFAHAPTTVGMYAARQLGVTFSFTGHANDIFQRRALLRLKLERATFVSCISHWHRGLYAGITPGVEERCVVIRSGVDTEQWRPNASEPGHDKLRVLSVCRLVEKKGIDTLITALSRAEPSTELTVVGDGPERSKLERLAERLGCSARVRFLGMADEDTVRKVMRQNDVLVLPCRTDSHGDRDGVPVALIEAMACGLAVISGDLPAIRELIEHGVDGLLVHANNDVEILELLSRLNPDYRSKLGLAARAKIEKEFTLKANSTRMAEALSRAVSSRAALPLRAGSAQNDADGSRQEI